MTQAEKILSKVLSYILEGWPLSLKAEGDMKAYWNRRDELSVEMNCITWGTRVLIPSRLREHVMQLLHSTHIGMTGMKMLARSYIWWPNLNTQIETTCRTCSSCGKFANSQPKVSDHPWTKPTGPWQRVHVDYAGPFLGHMWLVLQDAYSKWPEVIKMRDTKARATIRALEAIFARTGYPCVLVSDNGNNFKNEEMRQFTRLNKVKHVLVPTYSPKSNGLVERFNSSWKKAIKKMYEEKKDLDSSLAEFLISYRNCPHSVTKTPPSVLMYNRTLRSKLHYMKPADQQKIDGLDPDKEQKVLDGSSKERTFDKDQKIWVQLSNDKIWRKARVRDRVGSSHLYDVECGGRVVRKHADVIRTRTERIIADKDRGSGVDVNVHVDEFLRESVPINAPVCDPVSQSLPVSDPVPESQSVPVRDPESEFVPVRDPASEPVQNQSNSSTFRSPVLDTPTFTRRSKRNVPPVNYKLLNSKGK